VYLSDSYDIGLSVVISTQQHNTSVEHNKCSVTDIAIATNVNLRCHY